jgi:hypothetical protein
VAKKAAAAAARIPAAMGEANSVQASRPRPVVNVPHILKVSFYEWLVSSSRGKLPEGPPVWVSGDCHVGNLGPGAQSPTWPASY